MKRVHLLGEMDAPELIGSFAVVFGAGLLLIAFLWVSGCIIEEKERAASTMSTEVQP